MKKFLKNKNIGMTFLELVVVLGIFGAIAATVLFNYGDFSANVKLQNLAQDVALQIKKAQTDAVSGRNPISDLSITQSQNLSTLIPGDWTPSYGVAFTTDSGLWTGDGRGFIYYFNSSSDDDGNGFIYRDLWEFESGNYSSCGDMPDSECLQEINMTSGDVIDLICFNFTDIPPDGSCDGQIGDKVYISFTRPRPNATIIYNNPGEPESNVFIRITSPRSGGHKYVSVWESGFISVK